MRNCVICSFATELNSRQRADAAISIIFHIKLMAIYSVVGVREQKRRDVALMLRGKQSLFYFALNNSK